MREEREEVKSSAPHQPSPRERGGRLQGAGLRKGLQAPKRAQRTHAHPQIQRPTTGKMTFRKSSRILF